MSDPPGDRGDRAPALRREIERLRAELLERVAREGRLAAELAEARRAAEEAQRQRAQAESASQAKSAFLANMSHELRTPLNSILGFAQLLERDRGLSEQHRESVLIIEKSGEHLLGLINDILEMAKIEAGRLTLSESGFDLHALLSDIEEMFGVQARRKGLELILDRGPEVPRFVRADHAKLRQVLINLLGNALKFTSKGRVLLRVWARQVSRPDEGEAPGWARLLFEVSDTGRGIAPEELGALFQAFSQAGGGREARQGTGLGLAISRELVRLMGGDIRVESEPGGGAKFSFDARVELQGPDDIGEAEVRRAVVGLAPGQPAYRVLVVDDRWESRHVLMKLLAAVGFEVRGATNGLGAIAQFEAWEPHLIFMDMRMPLVDGYEATRRIKATERGKATVIVGMTASAFEHNKALVLSIGCDDFLRKPYLDTDVFECLAERLGASFIYEDEAPGGAGEAPGSPMSTPAEVLADAARARAAAALPEALRAELRRAATRLDARAAQAAIDRVRAHDGALAEALTEIVRSFRFDRVLAIAGAEAAS
ncbi:MAG: response regulator [Polyangiaceae bacterium]|nr:response regulator [Polyangiaceae bacterium]